LDHLGSNHVRFRLVWLFKKIWSNQIWIWMDRMNFPNRIRFCRLFLSLSNWNNLYRSSLLISYGTMCSNGTSTGDLSTVLVSDWCRENCSTDWFVTTLIKDGCKRKKKNEQQQTTSVILYIQMMTKFDSIVEHFILLRDSDPK
jgi:hypothetical protein